MEKLKVRQICFYFMAMMPVAKLLVYPAALAFRAKNCLLFSALLNSLLEGAVVALVMLLAKKTGKPLFVLLEQRAGKLWAKIAYGAFALYFFASALLPLLEQKNFVLQVLYENASTLLSFAPFFLLSFYACTKGASSMGRIADVALPVFALSFPVLILLALPHADFAALLPLSAVPAREIAKGSLFSANWYTDGAFLLFWLGHFEYEKGAAGKVLGAYAAGTFAVLLFLAVFYAVFADIALRQQNAVAQIAKYTTSFTSLGRVDYLFLFALALVMIFRMCIPVQMCVHCLRRTVGCKPLLPSAAVNLLLLALTVFFNYSFLEVQTLFTQKLWSVFALFAYLLPAAAALLALRRRRSP